LGLNYITLLGEVISLPEKKHTLDGIVVTTFNVSFNTINEDIINKHSIKVSAVKNLADKVISQIGINDKILIEGRLLTKIVEDKTFKHKIPYIQLTNFHIVEKYYSELIKEKAEENSDIEGEIPF
jgi:single-stranded DNA-binding protein